MTKDKIQISDDMWVGMAQMAWNARDHAVLHGMTKVGAAAYSDDGGIYPGCNIEHRFRSHDIHAEVAALATMVASGGRKLTAILIVAERKRFTPCGACMDWIFELGGSDCRVGYQSKRGSELHVVTAGELMPFYPH